MDANNDGVIDEGEFEKAIREGTISPGKQAPPQLFPSVHHQELSAADRLQLAEQTAAEHFNLAQQRTKEVEKLTHAVKQEALRVEVEAEEEATRVKEMAQMQAEREAQRIRVQAASLAAAQLKQHDEEVTQAKLVLVHPVLGAALRGFGPNALRLVPEPLFHQDAAFDKQLLGAHAKHG